MENPMLKALPFVSALLAAATLWGQPEPVGVTLGQTVRLTVTARPPDSCSAQIGFLDNGGKPIGPGSHVSLQPGQSAMLDLPSSAVVKEAGQRVVIEPRVVPDQGIAASACQADVEVNEAKSSGGPREGVKVHGHWTIDVRNPDGTLASHSDFENSLQSSGAAVLVGSLSRASVTGLWAIVAQANGAPGACGSTAFCVIGEPTEVGGFDNSNNLIVSAPTSGPNSGQIVLAGSFTATGSATFTTVSTTLDVCAVGVTATGCNLSDLLNSPAGSSRFTSFSFAANNLPFVNVVAGQLVQVTVVIGFS
jgi:hypothetical protein